MADKKDNIPIKRIETLYLDIMENIEKASLEDLLTLEEQYKKELEDVYKRRIDFIEKKLGLVKDEFIKNRLQKQKEFYKNKITKLNTYKNKDYKINKDLQQFKADQKLEYVLRFKKQFFKTKKHLLEINKLKQQSKLDTSFVPKDVLCSNKSKKQTIYEITELRRQLYSYLRNMCHQYVKDNLPKIYNKLRDQTIAYLNQPINEIEKEIRGEKKLTYYKDLLGSEDEKDN